jgi:hypothetical protein
MSSDAIVVMKADHKETRDLFRKFQAAGDKAVKKMPSSEQEYGAPGRRRTCPSAAAGAAHMTVLASNHRARADWRSR